jgi:hypothetical protein
LTVTGPLGIAAIVAGRLKRSVHVLISIVPLSIADPAGILTLESAIELRLEKLIKKNAIVNIFEKNFKPIVNTEDFIKNLLKQYFSKKVKSKNNKF